jgi:hypothetical protein
MVGLDSFFMTIYDLKQNNNILLTSVWLNIRNSASITVYTLNPNQTQTPILLVFLNKKNNIKTINLLS